MELKTNQFKCILCKKTQDLEFFHNIQGKPYDWRCKPCKRAMNYKHYWKNREKILAQKRNMSVEERLARNTRIRNWTYKKQELKAGRPKPSSCEVCGNGGRIHYDHDHSTGKFRGWLCTQCNTSIGMVKDKIEILHKLISYLVKNGA